MRTTVGVRLMVIWLLCVLAGTLAPFDFIGPTAVPADSLFKYGPYQRQGIDFMLNLLLFMPLGALLQHEARGRSKNPLFIAVSAAAAALILSSTVEYLQGFLPTRDSSLVDVVANTSGAVMGMVLTSVAGVAAPHIRRESSDTPW